MGLSESQLSRFRRLRQSMLSQISDLSLGESCMKDLVKDILEQVLRLEAPLTAPTKIDLLDKGKLHRSSSKHCCSCSRSHAKTLHAG